MGAFLDKPETKKSTESGRGNGLVYGMNCMQGWRVEMEDAHVAIMELPGALKSWSYFGVFDGHAGAHVSAHCAAGLLESILETTIFKDLQASTDKHDKIADIKAGIISGFLKFDERLLAENPTEKSGSTAVVVFVSPSHIYFCNCGDSRGILVRNSKAFFSTEDHKPSNTRERRRIANAGGQVILSRVNGSLAVSRALGDFDYKQLKDTPSTNQLVSPEPDVTSIERAKDSDQLLILACDGIWDVFSNDDLSAYALQRLRCISSLSIVCGEILDTSLYKGSKDNMSILMVGLEKIPIVDPAIEKLDKELDSAIKTAVENTIIETKTTEAAVTTNYVANVIQSLSLQNYPPGGFVTKRALIESLCSRCLQST